MSHGTNLACQVAAQGGAALQWIFSRTSPRRKGELCLSFKAVWVGWESESFVSPKTESGHGLAPEKDATRMCLIGSVKNGGRPCKLSEVDPS